MPRLSETFRSPPPKRRFVEEFPRLDMAKLAAKGLDWVGFRCETEDALDVLVEGHASRIDATNLYLAWTDQAGMAFNAKQPMELLRQGASPPRTWFLCAGCSRRRGVLLLHQDVWRCSTCLQLKYSSQYITKYDKDLAEFYKLRRELSEGRRRYERAAAHAQKTARLKELERSLAVAPYHPTHNEIRVRRVVTLYQAAHE